MEIGKETLMKYEINIFELVQKLGFTSGLCYDVDLQKEEFVNSGCLGNSKLKIILKGG